MDSIQIDTGEISLCINGDESRVITFNPSDILFAEKFYKTLGGIEAKSAEFERQAEELDKEKWENNGLPINTQARMDLLRSICEYNRSLIDDVFGTGTSQKVFGDSLSLDAFGQFIKKVSPYFQKSRAAKLENYIPKRQKPVKGVRKSRIRKK